MVKPRKRKGGSQQTHVQSSPPDNITTSLLSSPQEQQKDTRPLSPNLSSASREDSSKKTYPSLTPPSTPVGLRRYIPWPNPWFERSTGIFNNQSPSSQVTLLVDEPIPKRWRNWWVRTFWSIVMISSFFGILLSGHIWVILLVCIIQTLVYREVISIGIVPSKERHLPWFRSLHWYFLLITNYFLYGESLIYYYKPFVLVDAFLMPLATHHRFISFSLYCLGLVNFVLNLKKGHYKFQFSHFCWTHMALLLVICQSHFIINNIFEGMFWFVLPVSLVICNDIMAYVFGFFFGRTPLIRLSPKKTWEGFLGGMLSTFVFAFFFSGLIASYPYMICPLQDLTSSSLSDISCRTNKVFIPHDFSLPPAITGLVRWANIAFTAVFGKALVHHNIRTVSIYPIQFHALFLAAFASLIAPFGGFFASGVKRAFKIKDFGDSIPGHGGITDRMDCQFIMGVFSYMYFQSFITSGEVTVGKVLETALTYLPLEQQIELHDRLHQYLLNQGAI